MVIVGFNYGSDATEHWFLRQPELPSIKAYTAVRQRPQEFGEMCSKHAQLRLPSGEAFRFRSQKPIAGITEITVNNTDANTIRIYVQDQVTGITSASGDAFSPRVGIVYQPIQPILPIDERRTIVYVNSKSVKTST